MALPVSKIQQEIRALSFADKAELLRVLLEELDGPTDADADAAWAAEIQRRSREIDYGLVQCIPAEEVFRKIDALIEK
jgi:putative addiction module component (TIGR02574 family)